MTVQPLADFCAFEPRALLHHRLKRHGLKDEVVFSVHKYDLEIIASSKRFLKMLRGVDATKSAAKYYNALPLWFGHWSGPGWNVHHQLIFLFTSGSIQARVQNIPARAYQRGMSSQTSARQTRIRLM